MYRHLQFSLTRLLAYLAIGVLVSVACVAAIHVSGGNVRPIIEFGVCLGIGGALSMTVPPLWQARGRGLLRRPVRSYLAQARAALFAPRRLQFSVQSGLIYLTVLCVWLGYCVDRLHRYRSAADVIVRAGGRVSYESREPFMRVRTVGIARRGGPWDDDTIRGLLPHIHALEPRRIVVGSLASQAMVAQIEAEFPAVELVVNRAGQPAAPTSFNR
jgi:hypothetical protein